MLFRKTKARMEARARQSAMTGYVALDRRLPVSELAKELLRKAFPDHWTFLLGEIALYGFVILVLTGTYLTLFFDPGMTEHVYQGAYAPLRGLRVTDAYSSTLDISFDVRGGLLIRQIHHWAALVFVAAIGVHMLRIFFTGAFRRPREVNWFVGVTLFLLALLEGFCGYSLPDDLLSGTGLRTANTIVQSIPVVGTYLSFFFWRGPFPGHALIPRLYIVHVLFVPGLLIALIAVHLIMVVYLKHTQWAERGKTNRNVVGQPMVPQFTAKSTGFFFMIFGALTVLGAVAQINPIWNYGPFRADQVATDAQPDWYVGFLEGALRIMPPWENAPGGHTLMWNVFLPAVVLPALLFLVMYLYPFFERWVTGDLMEHHLCDRPRDRPTRTGLGVAAIVFYAVLLLAGGNDVTAFAFRVSVNTLTWIYRVAVVVGPVLAFWVTKRICLALQAHDRELLTEGVETGKVSQDVSGGIGESSRPIPAEHRYRLLVRDIPRPLPVPGPDAARRHRLRAALSAWYYRDRVEMPATTEQRLQVTGRTADPVAGPEE
ncbi:cytochrome bc1 complex cytochrome b subunit [Streptantibioticus cattleyicolor]|uniref:Cytochrome bc1 complex cytochrome b subunit n=1 Tax=Streptantibioticus cattleyicolor (strain ATCC 35852 / DSM 46488 / JCM 4925 / NBRC 14057 / NRRL 8057) TaxID=1003195 RepID=F8JM33_STREN|nr:ubiquinol-cytochrome c reductase cytochrome b subunit [Streptantibioticus cattleyicolor]AEW99444.1 ubiquinol-cytochrome C reductase cytochrome subunit B [Streptantibioticus cattleyicolor NRRL 8057 = DSM 46488]CCB71515.1 Ubiquinol-cytochrome c reductase cytochrome b subunit [Streptantibioticus cattleyicolor NRRL 8057 = DSM 46488]